MRKSLIFFFVTAMALPVYSKSTWPSWFNLEAGVKGSVGGDLWVAAEDSPSMSSMAFTETTGGWAAGVGAFAEFRFFKYVGLDTEYLFGWDQIVEKDTINGVNVKFIAKSFSFKIPILLKGVLPLPGVKLSLGTGPMFSIPITATAETKNTTVAFQLEKKFSVFWTMNLGIEIKLPKGFRIPIDLRASYNLSQPSAYNDRVTLKRGFGTINTMEMKYQNTWEFRLLLGLGYELP